MPNVMILGGGATGRCLGRKGGAFMKEFMLIYNTLQRASSWGPLLADTRSLHATCMGPHPTMLAP